MGSRESFSFKDPSLSWGKPRFCLSFPLMSAPVYHHDLMQTCRLLHIPLLCLARVKTSSESSQLSCLCTSEQQYPSCVIIMLFDPKIPCAAYCFRLFCKPRPWIILTFHFYNYPLLLFFLSTGFKSQAGAWERKTVRRNLRIVFSLPLSKSQLFTSDLLCNILPCLGFCIKGKSQSHASVV